MSFRDEKQESKQNVIDLLNQRYPIEYAYQNEKAVFYLDKDNIGNPKNEAIKWRLQDGKAVLVYNKNLVDSKGNKVDENLKQKILDRIQKTKEALLQDTSFSADNIDLNDPTTLIKLKDLLSRKDFKTSRPGQANLVTTAVGDVASMISKFLTKEEHLKLFKHTSKKLKPTNESEWKKLCELDFPISYQRHEKRLLSEEKGLRKDLKKENANPSENTSETKDRPKQQTAAKPQNYYQEFYQILMNAEYMTPAESADQSAHRVPLDNMKMAILHLVKQPSSKANLEQLRQVVRVYEQKFVDYSNPKQSKSWAWDILGETQDKHGVSALTWAYRNNRRDVLDEYFRMQTESFEQYRYYSLEQKAVLSFQPENVLETFLGKPNVPEEIFNKCLGAAAAQGNLDAIKFIISKGFNPSNFNAWQYFHRDKEKFNLLQIAITGGGHLNVIKFLVENKYVKIEDMTPQGTNALHLAALYEHKDVAKYLLENISPDAKDRFINAMGLPEVFARHKQITSAASGKTPMHIAARSKDVEMTALLSQHGADLNLKDNRGFTPVQTTSRYKGAAGGEDFKAILQQQVKFPKMDDAESLRMYSVEGWSDRIANLAKKNPELINAADEKGNTALHYAVAGNPNMPPKVRKSMWDRDEPPVILNQERLATIDTLVKDCKANINAKNNDGMTPLCSMIFKFLSSRRGFAQEFIPELALVQHLIKLGADINAPLNAISSDFVGPACADVFTEGKPIPLKEGLEKMLLADNTDYRIQGLVAAVTSKKNYEMPKDQAQHFTKLTEIEQYITECMKGPDQKLTPSI